ncbi:Aldo/keto reductase [Aureobasidium pullulans]|uniref:Aldo/keto reductase n=1 Tax=Aureobasidium pullulans TaxID=5580 RepID=A0A4S9AWU1_AURPU|nr:Aldo/keto reductase [Aureobasidium pullulans]
MAVVANILETRHHLMPAIKFWVSPLCLELEPSDLGNSTPEYRERVILFDILNAFHRAGGSFIKIASNPQKPWIETTIGYWMKMRNTRKDMIIAISSESGAKEDSIMDSLESSLRRLDRPWVDIFYVHQCDAAATLTKMMVPLTSAVKATHIRFLGVSDTPAWYVAEANCYAYYARLCRFVVYRGTWSAYSRDFEHEIQPMCKTHELGVTLCDIPEEAEAIRCKIEGDSYEALPATKQGEPYDRFSLTPAIVTQELRKVATKADATIANTALAYMKHVSPEAVPIVRVSSVKQLESRVQALHIKITASDIRQIAAAARIRPIFSHEPLPYTRQQDAA